LQQHFRHLSLSSSLKGPVVLLGIGVRRMSWCSLPAPPNRVLEPDIVDWVVTGCMISHFRLLCCCSFVHKWKFNVVHTDVGFRLKCIPID
jgi:hypothetical protein